LLDFRGSKFWKQGRAINWVELKHLLGAVVLSLMNKKLSVILTYTTLNSNLSHTRLGYYLASPKLFSFALERDLDNLG
jgi:hypothetical protein